MHFEPNKKSKNNFVLSFSFSFFTAVIDRKKYKNILQIFWVEGNNHDTLTAFVLFAAETSSRADGLAVAEVKDRAAASAFSFFPACSASSCSLSISSKSLTFVSHSATTLAQLPMQLLPAPAAVLPALVCRYRADRRGKLSYPPPRTNKLAMFRIDGGLICKERIKGLDQSYVIFERRRKEIEKKRIKYLMETYID